MVPILGPDWWKTNSNVQFICWFQQKDVSSSLGDKNPHTEPLILTLKTKYSHNTGRYPPDIIKPNKNKNGHFKKYIYEKK
jgi:hypothetical protein